MSAFSFFMFVAAALLAVLGLMNQRKLYWKLAAWRYRDPEANEPSDKALSLRRTGALTGAALMAILGIGFLNARPGTPDDRPRVRATVNAAASRLEGRHDGFSPTAADVQRALDRAGGGDLQLDDSGSVGGGDSYEVTDAEGAHPVCLVVRSDSDIDVGASNGKPVSSTTTTQVTDGRC